MNNSAGPVPHHVWAVPAAVGLAACLAAVWHQVLWQDELATFTASTRSLSDLIDLARERDVVLAPYYGLMHVWTEVFGASPTSLRLPSALLTAAAAGMTALIGFRLFGRWAGMLGGLVLALLPIASEFGQEARPYALALFLAALSTLLLLRALESPRPLRWGAYGACIAALGLAQFTALALVGAHAVVVALRQREIRDPRLAGWLIACAGAALVLAPLAYVAFGQTEQVASVAETSLDSIAALPGPLFGATAVAIAIVGLAALAPLGERGSGVHIALALALVPVVVIVVISLGVPVFRPRYLLFTVVGWALLAGAALGRFPKPAAAAVLLALVAVGLPAQLQVRSGTQGANQPDYGAIARILEARGRPGDAIVMPSERGVRFRIGLDAYVEPEAIPEDVLATRSPADGAALDAWECRPATCIGRPARLWVGCDRACRGPLSGLRAETAAEIKRLGYVEMRAWRVDGGAISLYLRPYPAASRRLRQ